ncbi:ABC transporter permease [Listeria seeligeri]|uniref:ABC transporter permease n=1 Tax=Listeria seeligeri TaxID=1640 RepID=UPI002F417015
MMIKEYFEDIFALAGRIIKHNIRSLDTMITVVAMPIMLMLGMVYIFGGSVKIEGLSQQDYIDYIVPGILLMTIATGSAYTALRINLDKTAGMFERFKSMPIAKSAVIGGHVVASVIFMLISCLAVLIVAWLIGFRTDANFGEWSLTVLLLVLFAFMLTWLSVPFGLMAGSIEGAGAFSYIILMLLFVSSAFVPVAGMAKIVRIFAENQPMTPIIQSLRDLFTSAPLSNDIWLALGWMFAILIVSYIGGMFVYKKI